MKQEETAHLNVCDAILKGFIMIPPALNGMIVYPDGKAFVIPDAKECNAAVVTGEPVTLKEEKI